MKDKRSLHLKVQEFCDCFATTDPLLEMMTVGAEQDKEEGALKWLALTILHGINSHAKKISIVKGEDGQLTVTAKYESANLPAPSAEMGNKVFEVIKEITHLEGSGKTPLAVGIRDSSIEVFVKVKQEDDREAVTIQFPTQ